MGWFPKIGGKLPQIMNFNRIFHYFHHPFWGVSSYFWKHPYIVLLFAFLGDFSTDSTMGYPQSSNILQSYLVRIDVWTPKRLRTSGGVCESQSPTNKVFGRLGY